MKKNVLVFPCGSEIGLEIYRSLEFSKEFKLLGASSVADHGKFVYQNYIPNIPFVENDEFINVINKIIKKHQIDYIFPAHDSVVLKLAQERDSLACEVLTSSFETCELTRSKLQTYQNLKSIIPTPRIFKDLNKIKDSDFPIFLKPEVGQGSKNTYLVNNKEELCFYTNKDHSLMALEYLPGKEYTVDCFTDKSGSLLFSQGRERVRILNGISVNSKVINNLKFEYLAKKINESIDLDGVWFFQVKENKEGELALLEVAPRVAGTMSMSRMLGVNLPLLSLFSFMGYEVNILKNNFGIEVDRSLKSRYKINLNFENIYVDFDDTLIIDDKINHKLMSFIYRWLGENKNIYLITKHSKDIDKSLMGYKISSDIFTEIIHLKPEEEKYEFIKENSIFIDDSFSERKSVFLKTKNAVFSMNEIDCLEGN